MFIRWQSFLAGDTSNIATANLTVPIVNGVLGVKLVPTTTASAGAQYNITYSSGGVNQFTEVWAVPPSGPKLRVRDVRLSSGTVIGPPPLTSSPIQIGDVTGLTNALAVRPTEGVGFGIGRAAVINQAGQIEAAAGNLGDCVHVDGTSNTCGGGGGGGILPLYSDAETPGGTIDGINTAFTLGFAPSPIGSLILFRNGLLQVHGFDYAIAGNAVTFFGGSIPQPGDQLLASYRYGNPSNPLGTLTAAQVICSSAGIGTSATVSTSLGTCTIPAGLLITGDRIEVQFQYLHTGTATAFTGELHWGASTILSRTSVAGETALAGRSTFGILRQRASLECTELGQQLGPGEYSRLRGRKLRSQFDHRLPRRNGRDHQRRAHSREFHSDPLPGADQPIACDGPSPRLRVNTLLNRTECRSAYYVRGFRPVFRVLLPLSFPAVSRKM